MAAECPICMEEYESPKTLPKFLPCGHVICLVCIKRQNTSNYSIPCSVCRKETVIPDGGVDNFPTVFSLLDSSMQCDMHKRKVIKFFCSDCNIGVCEICTVERHKKHRCLDLESDETRENALTQISRSEKTIHQKIADLKKSEEITEESLKKLQDDKNQTFEKIQLELKKRKKELTDTADRETKNIENIFNENKTKIKKPKTEFQQVCNLLESRLEHIHPAVNSSSLRLLKSVPKLEQLERESETTVINYPGVQTTEWRGNNKSIDDNILGVSESSSVYIPCLNDFRFNSNIIKENGINYYSDDKLCSGDLVWSASVHKYNNGYFGVFVKLGERGEQRTVKSIEVDYTLTLLNNDTTKSVEHIGISTFKTGGNGWGYTQFMLWDTLIDPSQGFIDKDGIFHVKLKMIVNC